MPLGMPLTELGQHRQIPGKASIDPEMEEQPVEGTLPPGQKRRGNGQDHEDDRRPPPADSDQITGRGELGVIGVALDVGHPAG